ncbi:MAG: ABC transporter permease [Oscillospiraceae bacterium]|nr:ABC transporter permease [Oscillospiraceae bacterium]
MRAFDIIRTCLRNLTKRKLRTTLTVSGVLIGTSAIIVMMSLGIGMDREMTKMIEEWADLTMIEVYNYGGRTDQGGEVADITDDVIKEFKALKNVTSVMPVYTNFYVGEQIAVYNTNGKALQWTPLVGVYMDELENFGFKLKEGRFKQPGEPNTTVLFGSEVGEYVILFEEGIDQWGNYQYEYAERDWDTWELLSFPVDHMGDEWYIIPLTMDYNTWRPDYSVIDSPTAPHMDYNEQLNVVGVIEGSWSFYETVRGIFIDISYIKGLIEAYNELNPDNQYAEFDGVYNNVRIRVNDMDNVVAVEDELKAMGYQTWSANEMRENMRQQIMIIQLLLAALAAVSLFVAAMNITNTMIMAIVERTKEIGIMKVLGCDVGKIRIMFLGEAAAIGFLGGVAGIILSLGLSFIINNFLGTLFMGLMGGGGSEAIRISVIPPWLALMALGIAMAVGVVAGLYPAHRSVKISALAAISHE